MQNNKLTELSSISDISSSDIHYVVDVSDTTDGVDGTSKFITNANIYSLFTGNNELSMVGDITTGVWNGSIIGANFLAPHAINHSNSGSSNALKLDDVGEPEDNTDLNTTIYAHGLLPKTNASDVRFLNGFGLWSEFPIGKCPDNMVRAILIEDTLMQAVCMTSTGYAAIKWWDGTIEIFGDGTTNIIEISKSIPTSSAWDGSCPKEIYLWPATNISNSTFSGNMTIFGATSVSYVELNVPTLFAVTLLIGHISHISLEKIINLLIIGIDNSNLSSIKINQSTSYITISLTNNTLLTSITSDGPILFNDSCDISGNALTAEALNEFFMLLAVDETESLSIDISGNPGTATADTSIATAKGYTVVTT
jgi:hypothetical protein